MGSDDVDPSPNPHGPPALDPAGRAGAVDSLLTGLDALQSRAGDRIPIARPHDGEWLLSRRGSWSAGCWAGSLWLRALVRGTEHAATRAREATALLDRSMEEDTSARATVFWPGAAAPDGAPGRASALDAASRVARSFDPELGMVPDGTALGHGDAGRRTATIDAGFAVLRLLYWADGRGVDGAAGIARRHAATLLAGVGPDGRAHAEFGGGPPARPVGAAGGWARGQAWALLTAVAAGTDPRGTAPHPAAVALAGHAARLAVPPPDRLDDRAGLADTGAAAITAYALLGLAEQDPAGREGYRERAGSMAAALVHGHLEPGGGLRDGTYRLGTGRAEPVESVWGNFFLLATLLVLDGRLGALTF